MDKLDANMINNNNYNIAKIKTDKNDNDEPRKSEYYIDNRCEFDAPKIYDFLSEVENDKTKECVYK